jgi:hypothetical protein
MKKRTKRLLGGLTLAAGALGLAGAYLTRKKVVGDEKRVGDVWARPGMAVTFRAELMPGREREERTYHVKELLKNGRVLLEGSEGEHTEKEFEPLNFGVR